MSNYILKVKCDGENKPKTATSGSAGIDLYNNGENEIVSSSGYVTVHTRISVEIPDGYVGLVFVRSGLGFRGLDLINSCGVIDSDYRGEIGLRFINHSQEPILLKRGDRVAQLVIVPYLQSEIKLVDNLSTTERGQNGFGSTGR